MGKASDFVVRAEVNEFNSKMVEALADNLENLVENIENRVDGLSPAQIDRIYSAIYPYLPENDTETFEFDENPEDLKVSDMLKDQFAILKAARRQIMTGSTLSEGVTVKEAKEYVSSVSSLASTLLKQAEKVQTFEREQAYEAAIVETMKEVDAKVFEKFETILRRHLERIK